MFWQLPPARSKAAGSPTGGLESLPELGASLFTVKLLI